MTFSRQRTLFEERSSIPEPDAHDFLLTIQLNAAVKDWSVVLDRARHVPGADFSITLMPKQDVDGFMLSIVYRSRPGYVHLPRVFLENAKTHGMYAAEDLKTSSTRSHEFFAVFAHVPHEVPLRLNFAR